MWPVAAQVPVALRLARLGIQASVLGEGLAFHFHQESIDLSLSILVKEGVLSHLIFLAILLGAFAGHRRTGVAAHAAAGGRMLSTWVLRGVHRVLSALLQQPTVNSQSLFRILADLIIITLLLLFFLIAVLALSILLDTHDRNTASDQGHVRLPRVIEFQRPLEAVALVSLSQTAALRLRLDPVAELVPMATADPVPHLGDPWFMVLKGVEAQGGFHNAQTF